MSYIVPDKIPKYCNKCPFGRCRYCFPSDNMMIKSMVDGKINKAKTHGYVCHLEYKSQGKYTKVMHAEIGVDIKKPKWCPLEEEGVK